MSETIVVLAEMQAQPGQEQALHTALLPVVEATRHEEGCLQYDLHVKQDDAARFFFYERWESQTHLDRHAASPHLTAFRNAAGSLLAGPARVDVYKKIA